MLILSRVDDLPKWDAPTLRSILDQLPHVTAQLALEWDLDAGEEWCYLSDGDQRVALIRAPTTASLATRFVLLWSQHPTAPRLLEFFRTGGAEVVEVHDFDAETLTMRPEDLAAFSGDRPPPAHVFDPARFAANDLVFVTQ